MKSRYLRNVYPLRVTRREGAAKKPLLEVPQVGTKCNFVGVVQTVIQTLILVVAPGGDSPPSQLEIASACELTEFHLVLSYLLQQRREFRPNTREHGNAGIMRRRHLLNLNVHV